MDLKIFLGISAGVLMISSFVPYFGGIFKGHTAPHSYTWLIWSITQSLAAMAIYQGGGGLFSTFSVAIVALMALFVFLLSLTRGREHIHAFDGVILAVALTATVAWWLLDHPVFAVVMIAFADGMGFIPTYRKTFMAPSTESLSAWTLYLLGNMCALLALDLYNLLTTLYLATMIIATTILITIIFARRL